MSFTRPTMLASLALVPALALVYRGLLARRARRQGELGTMGLLQTRAGRPLGWRRHVPPAVFLLGVTILLVGLARPVSTVDLPQRRGTVILAIDVSASMLAKDVAPSRIRAAQAAARAFVAHQPSTIRIGVVAFSDAGFLVQAPTTAKPDVLAAIKRLSTGGGTSVGGAIFTALGAIAGKPLALDPQALADGSPQPGLPFLGSAAVVLLSDGENTSAVDPAALADVAAQAGVRIYTVGLGSAQGAVVEIDGYSVATRLDETLLRGIATSTNGKYFRAADAASLTKIYGTIDLQLTV